MSYCHAAFTTPVVAVRLGVGPARRRNAAPRVVMIRASHDREQPQLQQHWQQRQRAQEDSIITERSPPPSVAFGRRAALASAAAALFAPAAAFADVQLTDYVTDTKDLIAQQRALLREVGILLF